MASDCFNDFFREADKCASYAEGSSPYPYQEKLGGATIESRLIHSLRACGRTTLLKKPPEMSSLRAAKGICFVCVQ